MLDFEIIQRRIETLEDMVMLCDRTISELENEKTVIKQWINKNLEGLQNHRNRLHGDVLTCKRTLEILQDKVKEKPWKDSVMLRDHYTCQKCGIQTNLTCHHILPRSLCETDEQMWDIGNGIVLCEDCHQMWHTKQTNSMHHFIRWLNE